MSLVSHPAFAALEARFIAEGKRAGAALRAEHHRLQRGYRKRLAFDVAAGVTNLDSYLYGLRTPTDERNVRVVARYMRLRAASINPIVAALSGVEEKREAA